MSNLLTGSISREECERRGGTYVPASPTAFGPHCRLPIAGTRGYQYLPIQESFSAWSRRAAERLSDRFDLSLGRMVDQRDAVKRATGLEGGALGVGSKVLGVNLKVLLWAVVVVLALAVYNGQAAALATIAKRAT